MANRKNKKSQETTGVDPDAASRVDSPTSDISALNAREFGDPVDQTERMADVGPRGSRAKVSPDTGELYYPEGAPAPARAAAKAPAAAPVRTPGNRDLEKGVSRGSGAGRASRYDYSNEGRTYEPKAKVIPRALSMSDELNPTESVRNPRTGRPYKKGGAVKKMANGGVTSASKRADGIASRGKTKCKMY
jgi:hypothetical protein